MIVYISCYIRPVIACLHIMLNPSRNCLFTYRLRPVIVCTYHATYPVIVCLQIMLHTASSTYHGYAHFVYISCYIRPVIVCGITYHAYIRPAYHASNCLFTFALYIMLHSCLFISRPVTVCLIATLFTYHATYPSNCLFTQ